jgi:hypothetical protein
VVDQGLGGDEGELNQSTEILGHRVVFKTWTYGEKQDALRRATSWRKNPDGSLAPEVDPWVLNDLMLLSTVVEWDLRDESRDLLPISLESLRGVEPPELVESMIAFTQALNSVSGEERKKS